MNSLAGQVALVTGASSGAGKEIARSLAASGLTVCLVGRDLERLTAAAAEAGNGAVAHRTDLDQDDDLRVLCERVSSELGGLDVLVHAAAIMEVDPLDSARLDDFDRQYRTNLRAPYALTQALLPRLREREGQVVFINSTAGVSAGANLAQYAATKHGLKAVADSLRAELNGDGVRVLTVLLGRTATPMQDALHQAEGKVYRPEHLVQPEDVASFVTCALQVPRTAEVTEISIRPARTG